VADYPDPAWFWAHLGEDGVARVLVELWCLRNAGVDEHTDPDVRFWTAAEIARIEGNLRRVPDPLPRPSIELEIAVRNAQARRVLAWLAQAERLRAKPGRSWLPAGWAVEGKE